MKKIICKIFGHKYYPEEIPQYFGIIQFTQECKRCNYKRISKRNSDGSYNIESL